MSSWALRRTALVALLSFANYLQLVVKGPETQEILKQARAEFNKLVEVMEHA